MVKLFLYIKNPEWRKRMFSLFYIIGEMLSLSWHAQPLYFIGLLLLDLVGTIIPLGQAWITKLLFDLLAQSIQSGTIATLPLSLALLLIGQIALAILSQALGAVSNYLNAELGRQLNLNIQMAVYRKLNNLQGLAPFEDPQMQNTIQLGLQGAEVGASQAFNILISLLKSIFTLLGFLGVLMSFSPLLASLVIFAAMPELYTQLKLGYKRFDLAFENNAKQRFSGYYGSILSAVYFAKELRLFNMGEYFLELYKRITLEINQSQRLQQQRELGWQSGLNLLSNIVSSGAFVVVVLQAFAGKISLGDMSFYTNAVGSVQGALSNIVFSLANMNESVLFFSRYKELMVLPQPIDISIRPQPIPQLNREIEFRNVSFRYSEKHNWVLRDVSLKLLAGNCLALVGLNGAGKTTLIKLLMRFYDPTEGQIFWDGIDIREMDTTVLRRHIGTIFQDFVHFDLTAFENIALGAVEILQAEELQVESVYQAARKAGIHDRINTLPQGYQTILSRWLGRAGEGVDLSGGEWQKIALARMFVRDADLLILDEPTAALDAQAEYELYTSFVELIAGKTSLLISHRFSTVRMANTIAVLENGRIAECGSHNELMALGNIYARLYNMQVGQYQ